MKVAACHMLEHQHLRSEACKPNIQHQLLPQALQVHEKNLLKLLLRVYLDKQKQTKLLLCTVLHATMTSQ